MSRILLTLACVFFALNTQAEGMQSADSLSTVTLKSKEVKAWDKNKYDGAVKLMANVSEQDTTYTLCFTLRDLKGLDEINAKAPVKLVFDDDSVVSINANNNYLTGRGNLTHIFIGLIPFGYSTTFDVLNPRYDISKEDLLKIVNGKVVSAIFQMKNGEYSVPIKSNRLSDAVGEACATLKMDKKDKNRTDMPEITSKTLFGDAKLRHKSFGWNNSIIMSVGYDHIHTALTGKAFTSEMARDLFSMDIILKGFYIGAGIMGNDYGSRTNVFTGVYKIGPAFRYGDLNSKFVIAPYIGGISCDLTENGNAGTIDSESKFLAGLRLSYVIKHFEVSTNISTHEIGFNVGCSF